MMQLTGGSVAALSAVGAGDADAAPSVETDVDGGSTGIVGEGADRWGEARIGHLYTPARSAEVVVWRDQDTVYADGPLGPIARGEKFHAVMRSVMAVNPSKVVVQKGTYALNGEVVIPSETIVTGVGPQTKIVVDDATRGFFVQGTKGSPTRLTASADVGEETLRVGSALDFEDGGYALVNSERTSEYRDQPFGEIQKVRRADNGRIHLRNGGLLYDYRESDDAKAAPMELGESVLIRDLQLVGADKERYRTGIVAKYATNVTVENCTIHGFSNAAVQFTSSINSRVTDCELFDCHYEKEGLGYGVTVNDASRNITVKNCVLYDFKKHATTVGGSRDGFPTHITFCDNEYYRNDADVHVGDHVVFRNNRFVDCYGGILTGAFRTYVDGCVFENVSGHAIQERGLPEELYVSNCTFRNVSERAIDLYSPPSAMTRVVVRNNVFENIDSNVVRYRIRDGRTADAFDFSNNFVRGCGTNVTYAETRGSGKLRHVTLESNYVEQCQGIALGTAHIDSLVTIRNNTVCDVNNPYAVIARGRKNVVTGNSIRDFSDRGLLLQSPSMVYGNTFTSGGSNAMVVENAAQAIATFNSFADTTNADIYVRDAAECKLLFNDLNTNIAASERDNLVQFNFGTSTTDF